MLFTDKVNKTMHDLKKKQFYLKEVNKKMSCL